MATKFNLLLLTFILGFFLMPNFTYACGTTSGKSCCNKHSSTKSEKKNCCKKRSYSTTEKKDCCEKGDHSKNKSDGCDGKCNHNSCNCSTLNYNTALSVVVGLKDKNFNNSTEKQNFYPVETSISPGFYSVWLLPKIS